MYFLPKNYHLNICRIGKMSPDVGSRIVDLWVCIVYKVNLAIDSGAWFLVVIPVRHCYSVTPGIRDRVVVPTPHFRVLVVEHVNFLIDACEAGQDGYIRGRSQLLATGLPGTKRELSLFATLFESANPPMTKPGINQNNKCCASFCAEITQSLKCFADFCRECRADAKTTRS